MTFFCRKHCQIVGLSNDAFSQSHVLYKKQHKGEFVVQLHKSRSCRDIKGFLLVMCEYLTRFETFIAALYIRKVT